MHSPQAVPQVATPTYTTRALPSGSCGFVLYAAPTPYAICQCRSFWPAPHVPILCACGHHACYHDLRPRRTSLDDRVAMLEDRVTEVELLAAQIDEQFDELDEREGMLADCVDEVKAKVKELGEAGARQQLRTPTTTPELKVETDAKRRRDDADDASSDGESGGKRARS